MGLGFSSIRQQLPKTGNFNALSRAEKKIISDRKSAPKHKTYSDSLSEFRSQNPDLFLYFDKEVREKNSTLDRNLKSVFVSSEGSNPVSAPLRKPSSKADTQENVHAVPGGKFTVETLLDSLQRVK